jgi:hypothetical protein
MEVSMAKYKVGDNVVVRKDLNDDDKYWMDDKSDYWYADMEMLKFADKIVTILEVKATYYLVEQTDSDSYWTDEMFVDNKEEEPKSEPTPTPVVNVNVTVNLYENACWYCRKGGLVDLYLAGAMGICPSCGRVCNNTVPTKPKKESIVIEFKPKEPKENKPLSTETLKALPQGTRVFTVWLNEYTKKPRPHDNRTCWRTVVENGLERKTGYVSFRANGKTYLTYLEMPEGYVDNDP